MDLGLAQLVTDLSIYQYPADKKRTAATTAKMRSAESALDYFWESLDRVFLLKSGKRLMSFEGDKIASPQYTKNVSLEKQAIPSSQALKTDVQPSASIDFSYALAILEKRSESTIDRSQPTPAR